MQAGWVNQPIKLYSGILFWVASVFEHPYKGNYGNWQERNVTHTMTTVDMDEGR